MSIFNDLQLPINGTYIFEICMTTAFKWGIGQVPELASCWDSHSQLLERVIKMSPDGADFLHKRFYGWQQYPYQKSESQLFSIWSKSILKFPQFLNISMWCRTGLRRAETLIFGRDTTIAHGNICAKNQRHLAKFLLYALKAEIGYLSNSQIYELE